MHAADVLVSRGFLSGYCNPSTKKYDTNEVEFQFVSVAVKQTEQLKLHCQPFKKGKTLLVVRDWEPRPHHLEE